MARLVLMLNQKLLPVDLCASCEELARNDPQALATRLGMNAAFVVDAIKRGAWEFPYYRGGGYACYVCLQPLAAEGVVGLERKAALKRD
jgi:hypothetical protein